MKRTLLTLLLLTLCLPAWTQSRPLRVYLRSVEKADGTAESGGKTFLKEWTGLLNSRGAKGEGGAAFPTKQQLARTDVLVLYSKEAGQVNAADAPNLEAYLKRGGGL